MIILYFIFVKNTSESDVKRNFASAMLREQLALATPPAMRETSTVHVFKGQKVRRMRKKRFKEPLSLNKRKHVCAEKSKANNATSDGKEKKVRECTIPVIL
jgi:hypothetical protein